ncbi:MAG: site-specific DNA-methyltransferase [Anaerolineae bacterium]|nr:site-specific DNA-methyltransferase [Anaerolineae bacterium]
MTEVVVHGSRFFNEDCIGGCRRHIADTSVDLIVTDPPYGIAGDTLHKHYNRDEDFVIDGYVEVPADAYGEFSHRWLREAARILKPNGQLYVVSGYTHLYHVLGALRAAGLQEVNHIIWKYNFGVFTRTKYVSSHYHILLYEKPGSGKRAFNLEARYGLQEQDGEGGSLNYQDREDVWIINRDYKPGQVKNKNELPVALLVKMIQYSSHPGDWVCDPFMGGFSTARVALGLGRNFVGFEISQAAFDRGVKALGAITPGDLLDTLPTPEPQALANQGKPWDAAEIAAFLERYAALRAAGVTKKDAFATLSGEFGRGRWAFERILKRYGGVSRQ